MFESLFDIDEGASQAELRAAVERFEALKSAAAAAQARATALWAAKRRAAEEAAGIPAAKRGKGLGAEVALARHDAPVCGGRHLGFAQALVEEMPHTLAALECGGLSEWRATLIVRESACLSVAQRRELDAELCGDVTRLAGWGNNRIEAEAKKITARLDAAAVVARGRAAVADCAVSVRPVSDTMMCVSVRLPLAKGVGLYAACKRAADTTFDARPRGQVMAETVYERVTGHPADGPVPVALSLVMADTTLAGDDDELGWLDGYGPVPAGFCRALTGDAAADAEAKATLRRLYRHPESGQLVAMESTARKFPKALALLLQRRDRTCRTPYCNAPIRHHDHAVPARDGGKTSAGNGLGLCEACNYAKEAPGWRVTTSETNGEHRAEYVTPTGATYTSIAPVLPGPPVRRRLSLAEGRLSIDLVTFDAA
ncbi:HNH endonuclease signature motif containing protein [Mycobacterium sp. ITM-2016-00317]|uniref:HNH endonuclease n=1 Tax=Mycobacterium sp. ITM-2016-00317 TaxID=2099694 RepID=UPI00287F6B43|nr:HNH endonuclease signature motif containing protein [Mycobacterium sp. ITM-2016-00317]WNG87031.1 HNH endonuclease signature motif containing protein [Mycobacterium sp. ITM-2016-00317]